MDTYTKVTLSNGLVVANFSSNHPFTFEDGTVLPACSDERCRALMLEATEVETPRNKWIDISLSYNMTNEVWNETCKMLNHPIDIIIVPLPVLMAWKEGGNHTGKLRTGRVIDRVTKTLSISKFCK